MQRLISRTKCAFNFSAEELIPSRNGNLYMWTFTYEEVLDVKEAKKRWSKFQNGISHRQKRGKAMELAGLRVFQMHPGGHGLHVHLATGCYLHISWMRRLWRKAGGGRIHVTPIAHNRVGYLARYLGRAARPYCLKGARLWAKFGKFNASRVKDIVIESDWTRTYRLLAASLGKTFTSLPFYRRTQAVSNVEFGHHWAYNFASGDYPF
jgi:hypothetical protein